MKALIKTKRGKGNVELVDNYPEPQIADHEVLLKVKAIGMCGTDYHIYTDEFPSNPPVLLGHEFSGVVVKRGSKVQGFSEGTRVVSELSVKACGTCVYCKTGNAHICPQKTSPGHGIDGACADYIKMPYHLLHQVPDTVSDEEAALVEPSAIVVHALLERTRVNVGDFVVIMGPGPVGLLALQMAKIAGAGKIMVVGTTADEEVRLPLAKKLGADYVVNCQKEDPLQLVQELTGGLGVDLVVEGAGAVSAINMGIEMLRKHGKMCVIGIPGEEYIQVKWKTSVFKAIQVIFSYSSSSTSWDLVLKMLEKKVLDVKSLISYKAKLEEWEEIFRKVSEGKVIKAVLEP
ncbi:MAG: zinc-dependent alcohol dehydrogenase [Bacillota bacterium]|uniref:Alcohol dehydrogenase catalytic domain-containing protein n=1 Tax=Thermanaerosceptrum fracticalcis TaxID=1712410 RepID=A0A7G6E4E2_THEFR|nr:alcohol dehydrogenase catalytic domain-containing protein [Thermanaerosceptrum fracticalcis]QNB46946.1 alcohol dehydrogenase catalytic domain-containing protein [Thermanaerosceptrum fracticalcis]